MSTSPAAPKIVFLSPAAQGGGAEAALVELLRALREARPEWNLHVIAAEDGPLLGKLRQLAVAEEVLPYPDRFRALGEDRQGNASTVRAWPWRLAFARARRLAGWAAASVGALLYWWKLRNRLEQLRPDIVHTNGMKMHLLGAVAKPGTTRLIWHLHDYLGARPTMQGLLRWLSSRCQLVVANSESVAADARRLLPQSLPVQAVYNAVDVEVFTPTGSVLDLDALAGMPPAAGETVRVGLVATFAFWKGHEVFLRAAAAQQTTTPVRFYVIGGPVYATAGSQSSLLRLQEVARLLGIENRVVFTGFVEDVPAAMRALDIVVHASTEPEPFGLVIVQAMACARAVIISAAGGASELVEPGVDALKHLPGDTAALAAAIRRLAADAPERARLGAAGRASAERRFTRAAMAARIVPLYEALQTGTEGETP